MRSAEEFGTESTVMKPGAEGEGKQMIQAYVVPRHEILNNPAFEELREWEGLGGEGSSSVNSRYVMSNGSQYNCFLECSSKKKLKHTLIIS